MWTESQRPDDVVVLTVQAFDQDLIDAIELREFLADVKVPSEEQRSRGLTAGGAKGVSGARVGVALASLGTLVGLSVAAAVPGAQVLAMLGVGSAIIGVSIAAEQVRGRPDARLKAPRRFELVIGRDAFEVRCEGATSWGAQLVAVNRFLGGKRLDVVLGDGTTKRLSLCVPTHDHAALAGRLNELLRLGRAARGGYR